ncbi:MAG: phosphoadenosine phosphosulfate reductase family protein [Bacteroidales bacterium]|nr:phosphoadenosine phosphosulfate reductase family protein [Bacteroidales bacterium]
MNGVHDAQRLAELTALPLERKIQISQTRIIEWYTHYKGDVCVAFSGGKDSTVLLHLVRSIFPDVKAVFSNTGLEYPEIRQFATSFDNVDVVSPKMRFDQVISTYGYPIIGKEVAEAIHYARKICRSQTDNVERERDTASGRNFLENGRRHTYRKRTELLTKPHSDGERKSEAINPPREVEPRDRGRRREVAV